MVSRFNQKWAYAEININEINSRKTSFEWIDTHIEIIYSKLVEETIIDTMIE